MTAPEKGFWATAPSPAAEPWVGDVLCAQTDPEAFFPEKGGSTLAAKKVCARCPVEVECLEWALVNDERFGVWGNTSQQERKQIRARLGLTDSDDDVPEGDEPA